MHKDTVTTRKATRNTSVNVPKIPVSIIYGSTELFFDVITVNERINISVHKHRCHFWGGGAKGAQAPSLFYINHKIAL